MSNAVSLKRINDGISKRLAGIETRGKKLQSFLNREVVEIYRNLQRRRWITENRSEGERWTELNPIYKKWKLVRFATYDGSGRKMLIATGRLYKSVIGPGKGFRKVATPKKLVITTSVPYAKDVNDVRDFTEYSPKSWNTINKAISKFLFKGTIPDVSKLGAK